MDEEFLIWYEENKSRFESGQFDKKEIAFSSWLEGRRFGAKNFPNVCKNFIPLNPDQPSESKCILCGKEKWRH